MKYLLIGKGARPRYLFAVSSGFSVAIPLQKYYHTVVMACCSGDTVTGLIPMTTLTMILYRYSRIISNLLNPKDERRLPNADRSVWRHLGRAYIQ